MIKKHNREKQTAVLRQAQSQRKQQKKEQVLSAIEEIMRSRKDLTFSNIALVAGCSVSYLYKWTELTAYIHELQNQKNQQLHELEEKEPGRHSLKTLHEVSKQRIRELVAENQELISQNEMLRGHVTEIFELRSECERLRTQLRQLIQTQPSTKVVDILENKMAEQSDISLQIKQQLDELGIQLNSTLRAVIKSADLSTVLNAIEALKEARVSSNIKRPGAWLKKAIESAWGPNEVLKQKSELDIFNEWYILAKQKKLVLASQNTKDGIMVYTFDEQWVPFQEMLVKHPLSKF